MGGAGAVSALRRRERHLGRRDAYGRGRAAGDRLGAVVRAISGVLAGGLVVLAAVVVGASVLAAQRGASGPPATMLAAHLLAALVAVLVQVYGDRRGPAAAVGSGLVVLALTCGLLWTQWWS